MMTAVVQQTVLKPEVPPSVLLVGKKRTLDYISPALHRLNDTGELVIKATGSLSIVTAVDVAEIVKRDVPDVATQSINLGTTEFKISTGEIKQMSSIEIHLIMVNPIVVSQPLAEAVHVPAEQVIVASTIEIPIEASPEVAVDVPVTVAEKKPKRKASPKKKSPAKKVPKTKKKKKAE